MKTLQLAFFVFLVSISPASAATLVLNFSGTFSNDTVPQGTAPYVVAVFDDDPLIPLTAGYDVRLTIATSGLVGTEFITETDFNLNPLYDPTLLQFSSLAGVDSLTLGTNCCKADGDGFYDISFGFPTSGPNRMDANSVFTTDINLVGGPDLTAFSFNFFSLDAGGSGPFKGALHLQSIGGNQPDGDSTWLFATQGGTPTQQCTPQPDCEGAPVPEPASLTLLGMGLVGVAGAARKRLGRK